MGTLILKEIFGFFSSVTGYLVIVVFLTVNGLFIWVFPGSLNIPESGYATIDTLFIISPWLFLFLIPAVTMRLFTEEVKSGTIELLLVRPLTDMEIVFSKYFAAVLLSIISIIPTFIYFWSVSTLGNPPGNIDSGAVWGSYIGLLFLSASYCSIGLFASSLTDNSIVAFIVALFICFFFFYGFELIGSLPLSLNVSKLLIYAGINEHYSSISRGVVDSRDIVYFSALISSFLLLTKMQLRSR